MNRCSASSFALRQCDKAESQKAASPHKGVRDAVSFAGVVIVLCGVVALSLASRTLFIVILVHGAVAGLLGALLGYCVLAIEVWRIVRRLLRRDNADRPTPHAR